MGGFFLLFGRKLGVEPARLAAVRLHFPGLTAVALTGTTFRKTELERSTFRAQSPGPTFRPQTSASGLVVARQTAAGLTAGQLGPSGVAAATNAPTGHTTARTAVSGLPTIQTEGEDT